MAGTPGAAQFSAGCAACSRWRCGTGARGGWSWRATGSARSRSITRPTRGQRFCSARRSRRCWPGRRWRASPNLTAIDHYLTLQYVPAPETAFAGIARLPAAHYLVVETRCRTGGWREPEPVRYWALAGAARGAARPGACGFAAGARRASRRGGAAAADRRRAARRVSVGRGRFGERRRDDGAGRRRPGQDLLDRVCRKGIRRDPLCPDGRRALRHRARGAGRRARRGRRCCRDWSGIMASRSPTRRRSRPITSPRWRGATSRSRSTATAATRRFSAIRRYQAMRHLARLDRLPGWGRQALARLSARSRPPGSSAHCGCRKSATSSRLRPSGRSGAMPARSSFSPTATRRPATARRCAQRLGHSALDLLAPYFAAAGRPRRRGQLGRSPHLSARRSDGEGRCRQHGARARDPLAAARPRAARMGRQHPRGCAEAGGTTKALFKAAMAPYLPRADPAPHEDGLRLPDRPMAARTS